MIHPTATIHPRAELDSTVQVGPGVVIDADVAVGPRCVIGPHAYLTGRTVLGADNVIHAGCVLGDAPQDIKYTGAPTGLRIGDRNIFREHVTVHRSTCPEEDTVIGADNYFMAHCHVGHNCVLGNHIILANGVALAGHVTVHDRAFLSGNCLVHQFVRVGGLALMQGGAAISKDLPPFTVARGDNTLCGLNIVGLRRAGIPEPARLELKRLYRFLFLSGRNLREAVTAACGQFSGALAQTLLEFIAASRRGVCTHRHARLRDSGRHQPGP